MIVITLRTDGNQRYSWMKNRRSLFANRTRPRTWRCSTISWCLSAAFSASSRLLGLKSAAARFRRRIISAAIATDVKRFCHQIKTDEVFGTHRRSRRFDAVAPGLRGARVDEVARDSHSPEEISGRRAASQGRPDRDHD